MLPDRSGRVVDEPVLETAGEHRRGGGGNQHLVIEHHSEVARSRIRDDAAGVVPRAEPGPDEVVEWIPVGAGDVEDAAGGLADRGAGDSGGDLRAGLRVCQTFTRERVDPRLRRGGDRCVTVVVELGDDLRAHEAGASDD